MQIRSIIMSPEALLVFKDFMLDLLSLSTERNQMYFSF